MPAAHAARRASHFGSSTSSGAGAHHHSPVCCRARGTADSNGAFDGMPILSGPISVGGGVATAGKGSQDVDGKASKPVDRSKGLWTRCDKCGVILYIKHLREHHHICFGCNYHLKMTSQERIEHMVDAGTWRPMDELMSPRWVHAHPCIRQQQRVQLL